MARVRKANVILTIDDDEVEKYFEKGFSILDKYGNVQKVSVPRELGTLQKAYQDQQVIIAEQAKQIESLKNEIADLVSVINEKPKTNKKKTVTETE